MPKKPLIKYTSMDFASIKEDLVDHAQRYYPNRYSDFNKSSFGSMMFDSVAYVGDMLSYYLDFQVNENYMDTAIQYNSVRKMASQRGYNFYGKSSTFGVVDLYILVPALENDLGPVQELLPIVKAGSKFRNSSGVVFTLTSDVDFTHVAVDVVASKFNETTGRATEYALRATGKVKSGLEFYKEIDVGEHVKFRRVRVGPNGINEIISVFDSDGHQYYQVDNLSQEVVYLNTTNPNAADDGVMSIIKPYVASRRFILEQDGDGTYIQFGFGAESDFDKYGLIDPSTVMLNMNGKRHITDNAFDPGKLVGTDKFGICPSNTTLRISYSSNNSLDVNTARTELNIVDSVILDFPYDTLNNYSVYRSAVEGSMEVSNPDSIEYDSSVPTQDEIKYRAQAIHSAQNRIVTKNDYEAYCYQMPPQFGSIKRVSVYNDPSGTNKRLCLYVISTTQDGFLTKVNDTTKINLKTWLNKNKMISDMIDIKDAKIINVGFDYEFVVDDTYDRLQVLANVNARVSDLFTDKKYIGEPIYITDIYQTINKTVGVVDTVKVRPRVLNTSGYSSLSVDIEDILSRDGTYINTPSNCVLEVKYPGEDIRGIIV